MPLLAYCLSELQEVVAPESGVGGLLVESLEQDGVRCFFSRSAGRDAILGPPARQTALTFHNVIAGVFQQVTVIPFRFPTILEDEIELRSHLSEQAESYRATLNRLRNLVQMELHLWHKLQGTEEQRKAGNLSAGMGGTQYLRARQIEQRQLADLAADLRRSGDSLIRDWRERPSGHGLRCFALIERPAIEDFKNLLATVRVPSALSARASGPWPASEFIGNP